jgi:hypothetical protein
LSEQLFKFKVGSQKVKTDNQSEKEVPLQENINTLDPDPFRENTTSIDPQPQTSSADCNSNTLDPDPFRENTTSIDPEPQTSSADCNFSSSTATLYESRNSVPNPNKTGINDENRVTEAAVSKKEIMTHSRSGGVMGTSCPINGAEHDK